jgi:hypothetical protein
MNIVMTRTSLVAGSVLALGCLVALAPQTSEAQVTKSGSKYLLRMKWTKGLSMNYEINMRQQGGNGQGQKMGLNYAVQSVKGTSAVVLVTVNMPGQQPTKQKVTIDDRGKATGGEAAGLNNALEFPKEPIAVGGTWKTSGVFPGMSGQLKGTSTNVFKAIKTEGGKQYAVIESTLKATGGGMTGNNKSTSLIDMADGHMKRSTMNMKMSISMKDNSGKTQTQTIDMVVNIARK